MGANTSKRESITEINKLIKKETNKVLPKLWDLHNKFAELPESIFINFSKLESIPAETEKCMAATMMLLNKDRSFWSIKKELSDKKFANLIIEFNIEKVKP